MKYLVLGCAFVIAQLAIGVPAFADAPAVAVCPADAKSPEIDVARAGLSENTRELAPRLQLADVLLAQGCFSEAVKVLEEGESIHPRNSGIQSRLRDARSMLSEQRYFDSLGRAEETARMQRNLLRCRRLADVGACDEALRAAPSDADVALAKADALSQLNRPAEAILVYRRASELAPGNSGIQEKLIVAETQRQTLLAQCQRESSDAALQACQAALFRGAPDEWSIHQRKGVLLQGMGKPAQALDSYIAASLLRPDNESVARSIVELTHSTGRRDALALEARGSALLTLKKGGEAVQVLREAQSLSPELPGLKARLAEAEKMASVEARRAEASARKERVVQVEAPVTPVADSASAPTAAPAREVTRTYSNVRVPGHSY